MADDRDDPWGSGAWTEGLSGALTERTDRDDAVHPFAVAEAERYTAPMLLGEGGMGRVDAVRDARLNRVVARKELAAPQHAGARGRLAQEAWITAHLEHPGIVPVYNVGLDASGALFYTMRLIRGRSLAESLAQCTSLTERLGLLRALRDACEAVGYAHAQGVVHRDLKPANLMLGSFGETQVVDWGLACVVGEASPAASGMVPEGYGAHTVYGAVIGTVAYMAPEQARAAPATPRSDVYSLGATLYELLGGQRPFAGMPTADALHLVRAGRLLEPEQIAPDAPPALLAVARRALAVDPEARYPDAKAMADEITAWMDGRRVTAHVYTRRELWRRFVRAQRVPLMVGAIALVLLMALGGVAWWRTAEERDRARDAEAVAITQRDRADGHLAQALLEKAKVAARVDARPEAEVLAAHALRLLGEAPAARGVLAQFAAAPRPRRLASAPRPQCSRAVLAPDGRRLLCLGDGHVALYDQLPTPRLRWRLPGQSLAGGFVGEHHVLLRDREAHVLADAETGESRRVLDGPLEWGARLVGGAELLLVWAGAVVTLDPTGAWWRVPARDDTWFCPEGAVRHAAWLPGGRYVAVCEEGPLFEVGREGTRLITTLPVRNNRAWPHPPRDLPEGSSAWAGISQIATTPDGRFAVAGTWKGAVFAIDLETGAVGPAGVAAGGPVHDLAVSPDGARVLVTTERGGPQIWQRETGAWLGRLPADAAGLARFVGPDEVVTVGSARISAWRLPAETPPLRRGTRIGQVAVAWSDDAAWLAAGYGQGGVSVWRAADGAEVARHALSPTVIKAVGFLPGRSTLISYGGGDREFARFEPPDWRPQRAQRRLAYGRYLGLLAGDWLVRSTLRTVNWGHVDAAFGAEPMPGRSHQPPSEITGLAVSPDRRRAVVAFEDGQLEQFDADRMPARPRPLGRWPEVVGLAVANSGRLLVQSGGTLTVLGADFAPQMQVVARPSPVALAWSADERWIAAGTVSGLVRVYDAGTGALVAEAQGHRERTAALAFALDGVQLASAGWDKQLRRWSMAPLTRAPEALVAEIEADWGLTLEQALTARVD